MEFYEVIEKRRTIRDFESEDIPKEVIERVISAAMKAPTNDHMRDWHFIIVKDRETAARLLDIVPKGGHRPAMVRGRSRAAADILGNIVVCIDGVGASRAKGVNESVGRIDKRCLSCSAIGCGYYRCVIEYGCPRCPRAARLAAPLNMLTTWLVSRNV